MIINNNSVEIINATYPSNRANRKIIIDSILKIIEETNISIKLAHLVLRSSSYQILLRIITSMKVITPNHSITDCDTPVRISITVSFFEFFFLWYLTLMRIFAYLCYFTKFFLLLFIYCFSFPFSARPTGHERILK